MHSHGMPGRKYNGPMGLLVGLSVFHGTTTGIQCVLWEVVGRVPRYPMGSTTYSMGNPIVLRSPSHGKYSSYRGNVHDNTPHGAFAWDFDKRLYASRAMKTVDYTCTTTHKHIEDYYRHIVIAILACDVSVGDGTKPLQRNLGWHATLHHVYC